MNSMPEGWNDAPVELPNDDLLLIAVCAHQATSISCLMRRLTSTADDSLSDEAPMLIDGRGEAFQVWQVVTSETGAVKHIVLNHVFLRDNREWGEMVVIDVAVQTPRGTPRWSLVPRQRVGVFPDETIATGDVIVKVLTE